MRSSMGGITLSRSNIIIETGSSKDLKEIYNINADAFDFPYTLETMKEVYHTTGTRLRVAREHTYHPYKSAILKKKIVGYILYTSYKRGYEILTMAVHKEYRRQKIGSRLVDKILTILSGPKPILKVVVNEYQVEAQLFFRSLGLLATGRPLRGLYAIYPSLKHSVGIVMEFDWRGKDAHSISQ